MAPAPTPGTSPSPKSRRGRPGYVEAGSRVILTNTFGANRFVLARHGLAEQVAEINRAGVEISLARGAAEQAIGDVRSSPRWGPAA